MPKPRTQSGEKNLISQRLIELRRTHNMSQRDLAYIRTSAVVLNLASSIPVEFVNMMQAILIFFVAAEQFLKKSRNKVIFNIAKREGGES